MKPLLRYILGNVKLNGLSCLAESIRLMKRLYDFEICIAYNNITKQQYEFILNLNVELIQAQPNSLPILPLVENWKLYPPRLDINRHEIIVDNDYILLKRLEELDQFLDSDELCIVSEDNDRNLGQFSQVAEYRTGINSGLYGIPPGYNFQYDIIQFLGKHNVKSWSPRFDDQGIVSCLLTTKPHVTIPLWKVPFCCSNYKLRKGVYGYHFVELNRLDNHMAWNEYSRRKMYA